MPNYDDPTPEPTDDSPLPWDEEDARLAGMSYPKSTAEGDIRAALDAYRAAFPGDSKPSISVSTFPDGAIQLFLSEPHNPHATNRTHGQGGGKTLDEAACNLKAHLARGLRAMSEKEAQDAEAAARRSATTQDRLNKAAYQLDPPPPTTGGFIKYTKMA